MRIAVPKILSTANGYKKILFLIVAVVIIALPVSYFFLNRITSTIHEGNFHEAQIAVGKYLDKKTSDIEVLQMAEEAGHVFVLYRDNPSDEVGLTIFMKYGTLRNKYRAMGRFSAGVETSTHIPIGKTGYYGAYKELPNHLSFGVVFGCNESNQAHSYTVFLNSSTEFSRIIDERYFIHIYYLNRHNDRIQGDIYNEAGEVIQSL